MLRLLLKMTLPSLVLLHSGWHRASRSRRRSAGGAVPRKFLVPVRKSIMRPPTASPSMKHSVMSQPDGNSYTRCSTPSRRSTSVMPLEVM